MVSSDSETSGREHKKYKHRHKAKRRSRSKSISDSEDERRYLKHRRRHSRSPRRSRSPDRNVHPERHCHGTDTGYFSETVKEQGMNIANFSFESYRYELREILLKRSDLVSDVGDFWKFVKNYETMQKRSGTKIARQAMDGESTGNNPLGIPAEYDKMHLVGMSLSTNMDQLRSQLPPGTKLTSQQLSEFQDIILLYLNFKQKERFTKLRKLRQNQANLPVAQYREQIVSAVRREQVVIIAGDTGCGKSTQVPQYLLKDGYKRIACTQPRRIACVSLCKRVAFETLNEYGSEIGYQIRFEKNKTQHTHVIFITEGLLLRQVSTDPSLSNYDVLVLDEVHERHLHGDFLLGVVKCLLYQRPELKVILMSATINIQLFQDYFLEQATIIQVPGRLYPIKLNYTPIPTEEKTSKSERINPAPYVRIMQLINEKYPREEKGDLLIFLSGMSEISTVVEAAKLYAQQNQGWIVLPLHSTLSLVEQDKVFDYPPDGVRKCIVSTNIAETSITIDGIRFVVDSGKVKEMSYDPTCKMQRLKEFWISQASAEQRKGRAGRTGPGVCYRLYSEEEYSEMAQYSTPEIQRVPLDSLLLQMVAMGLPNARKFPFIEPPAADSIENSIVSLKQQGALTEDEKLTTVGRMLSRLPVDIAIGKMLIMGSLFHQVEPVLSLAAALSVQTPFTNKAYRDPDCETSRKELESDHGDPVTLLNALREWLEVKHNVSSSRSGISSRQWCRRRGLEEQRFYEMTKLRRQFKELLEDAGLLQSNKQPNENMSSAERALRHGEVKLLRSMQRSYREAAPLKRRTLKLDVWELEKETDEPGDIDIRDVEFRLSNDSSQLQNLVSGTTACSYKDLMMLKLILCSGLYPQFAIADEFNHCKSVSEQLFHTCGKPYVALHPMSFFGNHPQVLQLEDSDIHVPQELGFSSKGPLSSKHQLLCYLSLLETTKPFLVTTMRMPAAQTLLLLSQSIDTSYDFSRLVCDSWLQLDFPSPDTAATLLFKAISLRNKWEKLLTLRLEGTSVSMTNKEKAAFTAHALERELSTELPQFMHTEICYTIQRLLPADIKVLYVGPGDDVLPIDPNPFHPEWEAVLHPTKGGMQVSSYVTYNCLAQGGAVQLTLNAEEEDGIFKCPQCDMPVGGEPIQRIQHTQSCQQSQQGAAIDDIHAERKPNTKTYECTECSKTLYLTPTEILRHKKQHVK